MRSEFSKDSMTRCSHGCSLITDQRGTQSNLSSLVHELVVMLKSTHSMASESLALKDFILSILELVVHSAPFPASEAFTLKQYWQ